jgi:hypothetical protein
MSTLKVRAITYVVLASAIIITAAVALSHSPPQNLNGPSPTPAPHMFDVNLVYAYVGKVNVTEHSHFGMDVHNANLYPALIYINYTYLGIPDNETCDAKFEGYSIELASDTGTKAEYTAYQGVEFNQSTYALPPMPEATDIELGVNSAVNSTILGRITDSGSFTSGESSLGLWIDGSPTGITLTLRRIGWWTVKDGSLTTSDNPQRDEVLLQVQLETFGEGFLYNKMVPQNQLAGMDPFNPPT